MEEMNSNSGTERPTYQDFYYNENYDTITITGYKGTGGSVTIPVEINEKPVTSIGDWAFYDKSITSVTIPNIRKTARFT